MVGALVGKPEDLGFIPDRPHTMCRICGSVFQPGLDRVPQDEYTMEVQYAAEIQRREWSQTHARTHTSTEHRQLHLSGRAFTPEALVRLAPLGIIPITDMALDEECAAAGLEAPRMPTNDVESR